MDPTIHNLAGLLTDGSAPLGEGGPSGLVTKGAGDTAALFSGQEFAFAGFSGPGADPQDKSELNSAEAPLFCLAGGAAGGSVQQSP